MKFSTAHIPLEPSSSPSVRHIHIHPHLHPHRTHLPLRHLPRHRHHHHHHHDQECPPPSYHLCTPQQPSADLDSSSDTFQKLPIHPPLQSSHGDEGYCIGKEANPAKDSKKASWPPHRLSEVRSNPSSDSFDHHHEHGDTTHTIGYPIDTMNQNNHGTVKGNQHGDLFKVSILDSHSDSDLSSTRINSIGGVDGDSARVKVSTNNQIKLMCSFGGKIMPRPVDGKLRYVGGDTHILNVARKASFHDVMSKLIGYFSSGSNLKGPFRLKYQLPNEDLDALISVTSDDDMQNMIEECEKAGESSRLRLFFFAASGDIDVVVSEPKPERGEGEYGDSSSQEQLYVNAINGNLCLDTSEDLAVVSRGFHQQQQQEAYFRKAYIKDVDMPNVMTHSKVSSTPPIPAPSSPSLALRYKSGFAGSDGCLQGLREQLSKVAINSQQSEGEFDNPFDLSASSSNTSHHDPQFYMAAESPKIAHHNLTLPQCRLANCQCKHDVEHIRPTDRHHEQQFSWFASDSPRMAHHDLSINPKDEAWPFIDPNPSHLDCSIVGGNAMEHYRDISHQRLAQPLKHSIPQQLNQQFDLQRSWYQQSDLDSGTTEHNHSDLHYYKQRQNFHRFHHQPSHDFPNPNIPGHDVSYGNAEEHGTPPFVQVSPRKHPQVMYESSPWNGEEHGKSPFVQSSPRKHAQTMHGSSRSFAYHIGSSPSSPRLNGVPDSPLKCSCGLQNAQVHRGVTASIGDQSCNRWPRHAGSGDLQSMKKNGCRSFSRFCDNVNHCIDSQFSHQSAIRAAEIDCRDHQIGNSWCHVHGRAARDCQVSGYQPIDCALHYTDLAPEYANFAPPSHECYDTRRKCFCRSCFDRSQLVMGDTDSSFPNRKNQVPESGKQRKGFELNGEIFSKLIISKEEAFGDFVGKRCVENEYGVAYSCNVVGGLEARRSIEARNEGVTCERRPMILQSGLIRPPKEHAPDGLLENFPTMSSPVHAWVENAMLSYAPGGTHLLCPDIIPLGSIAITEESSYIAHTADSVPISTVTVDDSCLNAPVSPVYDKTPLNSTNTTSFSFTPSNEDSPRAELADDINEELFGSPPSVTKLLADGMISSVLDSSSNEGIFLEDDKEIRDSSSNRGILLEEENELEDSTSNEGIFLAEEKELGESSSNEEIFLEEEKDKDPVVVYIEANQSLINMGNEIEIPVDSNLEDRLFNPIATQTEDSLVIVSASTANGWMKVETEVDLETILVLQDSAEKAGFKEIIGSERLEDDKEVAESKGSQVEEEAVDHGLQIIRNADLEDLKELGSGTFGTVFHGKWRGSDVAIKRIRASCFTDDLSQRERLINDFWKEARTLGQLHHPNVVAFYGVVPDGPGGTLATVTEYMVNGSLKQVLHKKDRTIDRRKRLFIAMDAAFGMEYLHSKNIVHFDLKCENLLVNMRDAHRPICKVGDFGLSKVKHQTLVSGGVRGTLPWMAPELLSGNGNMVTEKVDVFSFGVVMWELLTGEEPYASMHCGTIIAGIVNNTLRPSIPNWCDPGWRSLMEQCWSGDPSKRPTFSDVARELRAIAASMNMK